MRCVAALSVGALVAVSAPSAQGVVVAVVDESARLRSDAKISVGGVDFTPTPDSPFIVIPFSARGGSQSVIASVDGFHARASVDLSERFSLAAELFLDRAALTRRGTAHVVLASQIRNWGYPVSAAAIKRATISFVLASGGEEVTRTFDDIKVTPPPCQC
jgi:hypothetical protein